MSTSVAALNPGDFFSIPTPTGSSAIQKYIKSSAAGSYVVYWITGGVPTELEGAVVVYLITPVLASGPVMVLI